MFTGTKYEETRRLPLTKVAAAIRADLAAAQTAGDLPDTVKFAVRTEHGTGINVRIKGCADVWLYDQAETERRRYSEEAAELRTAVERICNAYQRDNSDIQSDYFDVRFYGDVSFVDERTVRFDAGEKHRISAARAIKDLTAAGRLDITDTAGVQTVTLDGQTIGTLMPTTTRTRAGGRWQSWAAYRPNGCGFVRNEAASAVYYLLPDTQPAAPIRPTHPAPAGPVDEHQDDDQEHEDTPAAAPAAADEQDQDQEKREPAAAGEGLRVEHAPATGTLIHGTRREDVEARAALKAHGCRWLPSLEAWYQRGTRDKAAGKQQLEARAEALRAAGHTVTVAVDNNQVRSFEEKEAERAERSAARVERRGEYADNAKARSEAAWRRSDEIVEGIPAGQPVMGTADRNRRNRSIDAGFRGLAESKKAEYHADRAAAAQRQAAKRVDPRVTQRRIEDLETQLRRLDRDAPLSEVQQARRAQIAGDLDGWRGHLAELIESGAYTPWEPAHFTPGDMAMVSSAQVWRRVIRVNARTITVDGLVIGTDTMPFHKIYGRYRDGVEDREPPATAGTDTAQAEQ